MAAAPSPAEMNRRHREFWDVESQDFERRYATRIQFRAPDDPALKRRATFSGRDATQRPEIVVFLKQQ